MNHPKAQRCQEPQRPKGGLQCVTALARGAPRSGLPEGPQLFCPSHHPQPGELGVVFPGQRVSAHLCYSSFGPAAPHRSTTPWLTRAHHCFPWHGVALGASRGWEGYSIVALAWGNPRPGPLEGSPLFTPSVWERVTTADQQASQEPVTATLAPTCNLASWPGKYDSSFCSPHSAGSKFLSHVQEVRQTTGG